MTVLYCLCCAGLAWHSYLMFAYPEAETIECLGFAPITWMRLEAAGRKQVILAGLSS